MTRKTVDFLTPIRLLVYCRHGARTADLAQPCEQDRVLVFPNIPQRNQRKRGY